jgi:arginine repressor
MPRGQKKGGVNRSQLIRDMATANRKLTNKEIVDQMAQKGHKVSQNLVYLVRAKMGRKRRRQRRELAMARSRELGVQNPVQLILRVKELASDAGGLKQLKQLVDALAE